MGVMKRDILLERAVMPIVPSSAGKLTNIQTQAELSERVIELRKEIKQLKMVRYLIREIVVF